MPLIRIFQPADWPAVWTMLRETFASGDTYPFDPSSSEAEIHAVWIEMPQATYVACADDGRIVGTYVLKPNQPGLGAHVCNCSYVVLPQARGGGIASAMCEHSQAEAIRLGYRAMQFNLVVSTNEKAVRLWLKLGFHSIGTLPGVFKHQQLGYVDAYIMFKTLVR